MEKKVSCFIVAVSLVVVLGLVGCGRQMRGTGAAFTKSGIPAREYLAGGGFEIYYVAPSDGTVYWVEETTQRILETESVKEGEAVEFGGSPDPDMAEGIKAVLGVDLADARFTFYFVPAAPKCAEQ